jgi:hypothetical protein
MTSPRGAKLFIGASTLLPAWSILRIVKEAVAPSPSEPCKQSRLSVDRSGVKSNELELEALRSDEGRQVLAPFSFVSALPVAIWWSNCCVLWMV